MLIYSTIDAVSKSKFVSSHFKHQLCRGINPFEIASAQNVPQRALCLATCQH